MCWILLNSFIFCLKCKYLSKSSWYVGGFGLIPKLIILYKTVLNNYPSVKSSGSDFYCKLAITIFFKSNEPLFNRWYLVAKLNEGKYLIAILSSICILNNLSIVCKFEVYYSYLIILFINMSTSKFFNKPLI